MDSTATVLVLIGAPLLGGAVFGTIPMPRVLRVVLAASVPAVLIVWLRTTNHGLASTITAAAVVYLVSGGWLFGFVAGRWLRRWRTTTRSH